VRATREALNAASQALEVFGGNGYMEDWPMARQLRDASATRSGKAPRTSAASTSAARCEPRTRTLRSSHASSGPRWCCDGPALAPAVDAVAATLADAQEAIKYLLGADDRVQLLQARRFTHLLADLAEGALLLDEATFQLDRDGDARKAVVARRFATRRLVTPRVRGILDDDNTVVDLFDAIVRYGTVEPPSPPREHPQPSSGLAHHAELVSALDERLGPPVDGYVNGTQVWLTPDGPGETMLEWRLHPIAGYQAPAGVAADELWEAVIGALSSGASPDALAIGGERRGLTTFWDGLECFRRTPRSPSRLRSQELPARRSASRRTEPGLSTTAHRQGVGALPRTIVARRDAAGGARDGLMKATE